MKIIIPFFLVGAFMPLLSLGQNENNWQRSKLSINFQTGLISTYMNLDRHYKWYHEICCFGYQDDDPDSAPTFAIHSNLSLNYRIKHRHQVGLGFEFSQMGENHQLGENNRDVISYLGLIGSHEFRVIGNEKVSIGIYNAFCFELPLYNDKLEHFKKGISHIVGLTWRFKINNSWSLSVNGVLKNALTEYNPISWYYDNHRRGYGLLLGASYKL